MEPWQWGVLLKPLLFFVVYCAVIFPIAWLIARLLPEGKFKAFMTKDRTRPTAPLRDRFIYGAIIVGALLAVALYSRTVISG